MRLFSLTGLLIVGALVSCERTQDVKTWPPDTYERVTRKIGFDTVTAGDAYLIHARSPRRFQLQAPPDSDTLRFGILHEKRSTDPITARVFVDNELVDEYKFAYAASWQDRRVNLPQPVLPETLVSIEVQSNTPFYVSNLECIDTAEDKAPNVLLVVIDTLLPDHTNLFGYARETTPNLSELAKEATLFENSTSVSSFTRPSIASMFSGYYPDRHGTTDQSTPYHESLPALAEALQRVGYATVGISTNGNISPENGYDRGFGRFTYKYYGDQTDKVAADMALEALESVSGRPWFTYVHFLGPHNPLVPMPDVWDRYQDPDNIVSRQEIAEILERTRSDGANYALKVMLKGQPETTCEDPSCPNITDIIEQPVLRELIRALYDAEIYNTDRQLRRLLDALRAQGDYENTLIIVISDHGEEFWHHGGTHHGHTLYDELTRILFLAKAPGVRPVARRIPGMAQEIDVVPTIADYLQVNLEWQPEGQSLRTSIDNGEAVSRDVARSHLARIFKRSEVFDGPGFDFIGGKIGPVFLRSARSAYAKGIFDEVSGEYRFFDLLKDPSELHPIYESGSKFASLVSVIERAPQSYLPGLNIMFCAPLNEPSVLTGKIRVTEETEAVFNSKSVDGRVEVIGDSWSFNLQTEPNTEHHPASAYYNPILSLPLSSNAQATIHIELNGEPFPLEQIQFWRMQPGEWGPAVAQPLLLWGYAGPRQPQLATTVKERPSVYVWFWDPGTREEVDLSPEMMEQMRTLGYL